MNGWRKRWWLSKTSCSSSATLPFPFASGADAAGAPPPLRWLAAVGVDQPVHPLPCGVNITPSCSQFLQSSSRNQSAYPSLQLQKPREHAGYQNRAASTKTLVTKKTTKENPNYQENPTKPHPKQQETMALPRTRRRPHRGLPSRNFWTPRTETLVIPRTREPS